MINESKYSDISQNNSLLIKIYIVIEFNPQIAKFK